MSKLNTIPGFPDLDLSGLKTVSLDLDGTAHPNHGKLSKTAVESIRTALDGEDPLAVVLNSSRSPRALMRTGEHITKPLGENAPLWRVSGNGAVIMAPSQSDPFQAFPIERPMDVKSAIEAFFTQNQITDSEMKRMNIVSLDSAEMMVSDPANPSRANEAVYCLVVKLQNLELVRNLIDHLKINEGNPLNIDAVPTESSDGVSYNVYISHHGVSKGAALDLIENEIGIIATQTAHLGNDWNDVSTADKGRLFGVVIDAPETILERATFSIPSVTEEGATQFLDHLTRLRKG